MITNKKLNEIVEFLANFSIIINGMNTQQLTKLLNSFDPKVNKLASLFLLKRVQFRNSIKNDLSHKAKPDPCNSCEMLKFFKNK